MTNPLGDAIAHQKGLVQAAPKLAELRRASEGFEASFMKDLLECLRRGTEEVHFGQGLGGDTYREIFDDAVSQQLARRGTLGIGAMVYRAAAPAAFAQATSVNPQPSQRVTGPTEPKP